MSRLWQFLSNSRVLGVLAVAALAAILFFGAESLDVAVIWAAAAFVVLLLGGGLFWLGRRAWRKRAATRLGDALVSGLDANTPADPGAARSAPGRNDVEALRKGMLEAITTIKTSKLGLTRGAAALYELPWYMVIGNPAAGKSSAIGHSGLTFPIPGSKAVQGVGGTRNCDWFFTTEGILLDTAGRYSVLDGDRAEWFSFLDLLKRHRARAPINGILIAVSVAELAKGAPEASLELAKNLRTRVQELTERLGVYAPVYVIFTKADLIAGFADFFHDADPNERERTWGATLRYNRRSASVDVLGFFDQHFDELYDGLKELSLASMAGNRSARMRPGVFTFPLEFAALKLPLRAFLATLFEENTYQFKPVFRGFYFTSALQEGTCENLARQRVASRFALKLHDAAISEPTDQSGYFLLDLFRKVIFADKELVRRYASRTSTRMKYTAFFAATLLLGCALGGWSWAYVSNRQLVANVQADLDKVVKLQHSRVNLQSRLEGLDILQDRIEQLAQYRVDRPVMLRFGLYQGDTLERKLRDEYFAGVREVMAQPVASALEVVLADVIANPGQLDAAAGATATSITDSYHALKTYLMLGDKTRAEQGHLNDQLTRYWRGWLDVNRGVMPREQMIRSAERLLTFYLSHIDDPAWPQLPLKLSLLDGARENLRRVVRGTPARERVYGDIKARAATRFPMMTVARIVGEQDQGLVNGSHAISGAFTREAWEKYVAQAVRDAANGELRSNDWVLKTVSRDDLTLEGSPEQIQKNLTDLYKAEYAREWAKFVQGVAISDLAGFEASVQAMNRLGDTQSSPIARLLKTIYQETSWDNPGTQQGQIGALQKGLYDRIKDTLLRRSPGEARQLADAIDPARAPAGPTGTAGTIGREFTGVARLVTARDKDASLMTGYLDALARVRTRLNQLKNQGDPGPGAKALMQQTLEGSGSELADALKYVDEQMLTGMGDAQKQVLRPLLVRPLMQTFAMIVLPSESEINKTWQAQVVEPFRKNLADKYPFSPASKVEASNAEICQVFGPEGVVAKFVTSSMGALVVRRGDALAARTWADIGITLAPQAVASFPGWIAPLSANGVAASNGPQTVFQLQALPAPGTTEYTVDIDGQQLRYRNTPPVWTNMVHPGPQGAPGAKISAITFDGRTVDVFNEPGQFGLQRMIESAAKTRKGERWFELRWNVGGVRVAVELKIVSDAASNGGGALQGRGFAGLRLPDAIVGRALVAPAQTVAALSGSAP